MRKGSIYIIKNKVNNKVYIGQTSLSVKERFKQHLKPSTTKKRGSYKLYNAINKYGIDNFYYEIIEENINIEDLDYKEIFYIDFYNSYKEGYNSTNGGDTKTICKVQDIEKLIELNNKKLTYSEIGDYFKVDKITIERTLHSLGIYRNNIITKEELLKYEHLSNIDIGLIFNVSPDTVSRRFKKYNIKRGKGCSNKLNKQNQKKCNDYEDCLSRVEDKLPLEVPYIQNG